MRFFLATVGGLLIVRLILPFMRAPLGLIPALELVLTILFLALPIYALYQAASVTWTARLAGTFVGVGVVLHILGQALPGLIFKAPGFGVVLLIALSQTGIMLWTLGLGALLALLIKDKNLLLPVGAFLAGLDIFLVFAPIGITRQVIEKRPELFKAAAMSVPTIATTAASYGTPQAQAYVGPADLFFLAMFFVALFRFQMRTRETLRWMLPVLLIYLLTVLYLGQVQLGPLSLRMLPALVPIGATVLLVNRDQFKLNRDEKISTLVVALIALAMAIFGLKLARDDEQKERQAELSTPASYPAAQAPEGSPGQGSQEQPR